MNRLLKLYKKTFGQWLQATKDVRIQTLIDAENTSGLSLAAMTFAALEAALFLARVLFLPQRAIDLTYNIVAAICFVFCISIGVLAYQIYRRYKKTRVCNDAAVSALIAFSYLFTSLLSALLDICCHQDGDYMMFFYVVQFSFLLFLSLKPFTCFALVTIAFGAFVMLAFAWNGHADFRFSYFYLFFVLAIVGNAFKYNVRVARHKERLLLLRHKEEYETVVNHSGKYIALYDLKHDVLRNEAENTAGILLGVPQEIKDPSNTISQMSFVMPESRDAVKRFFADMKNGIPHASGDFKLKTTDERIVWHHGDYSLLCDESGQYDRAVISFHDVTEQMEQMQIHRQRISEIMALAWDCDFYVEGSIDRWAVDQFHAMNKRAESLPPATGHSVDDLLNKEWKHLIHEQDYACVKAFFCKSRLQALFAEGVTTDRIEFRLMSETARWYGIDLCMIRAQQGESLNFFALFRDIDSAHSEYVQLVSMATEDQATGLHNRETTMRMIEKYLLGEGASGTHALMMLDLDNLKELNDTLGHQTGDDTLRKVGECLRSIFRKNAICGRIGGDEFFAFLKNTDREQVIFTAKKIIDDMQFAYHNASESIVTSVSIGVAMYQGNAPQTLEELYAKADAALYRAKAQKNTFHFADENAAASIKSPVLTDEVISFNLRRLFDNLANGIAVYHGTLENGLEPIYCDERLPALLGVTYEQFFTHMSGQNHHAIHPDDRERTQCCFLTAVTNGVPVTDTFRVQKGDGEYIYLTAFANTHILEDGSIDWYVVYLEARQTEQFHQMNVSWYMQFVKRWAAAMENEVAYVHLDATKNLCDEYYFTRALFLPVDCTGTATELLRGIARNIASEQIQREFLQSFSAETYRRYATQGVLFKDMKLPCILDDGDVHWYHYVSQIRQNPITGSVEVFATFTDIDNEVCMNMAIDRILKNEYEFLAQINVRNGHIKTLGDVEEGGFPHRRGSAVDYRDVWQNAVQKILPHEYWTEGMEALSFERILQELQNKPIYSCTFPVVLRDGRGERVCRWRFEYVDSAHNAILMTRTNLSGMEYGYDLLTGMPDRDGFGQRMQKLLREAPTHQFCLTQIVLENFTLFHEEFGYAECNRFLRKFAADLRQKQMQLGDACYVGHLERDHFAILLRDDCQKSPETLYDELVEMIDSYPQKLHLKLCMGVYRIEDPSMDFAVIYDCVQIALHACRSDANQKIVYYASELKEKVLQEQMLETELQNALDMQQFEVWFQPQVDHDNNDTLIGAEALVRWNHPVRGMIYPGVFIPMLEQRGLIYALDRYVWRHTCRHIRDWLDCGIHVVPVSLNVSGMDILQPDFLDTIDAIVQEYRIPHDLICFEVTESVFAQGSRKILENVAKLIEKGFHVAIDDFGSGYSSLSMLRNVPAHMLKLDMRFFDGKDNVMRNECILESVVRMAKGLGMSVLAEGVESIEQADLLRVVGCRYIQSFLYAKPLSQEAYMTYLCSLR